MPRTKAALCQRIDCVRAMIERVAIYIDTLHILVPHRMSDRDYKTIRTTCDGAASYPTKCPGRIAYRVQRPTVQCLKQLDQIYQDQIVTRSDIGIDLLVHDDQAASELFCELRLLVTQPRHGSRKANEVNTTRYIAPAWMRRNIVIYTVRSSKAANCPAVHIELRYYGADPCRRRSIHHAGDLLRRSVEIRLRCLP
jgi:hypothetical protein